MTNRRLNIPLTHLGNKSSPSLYWPQLLPFRGPSRWRVARYSRRRGPWAGRGRDLSHYDVGDGPRHKLWSSGLGPVTTCKTPASSNKRIYLNENSPKYISSNNTTCHKSQVERKYRQITILLWIMCLVMLFTPSYKSIKNQIFG